MKKKYRNLVLIIAIIPAIAIIVSTICRTAKLPAQPTEADYNLLKECALQVASGNTTIEQNVEVKRIVTSKSFLEIKVQSEKCVVTAQYPLKEDMLIKDGKIYHNIDYDNVTYIEESRIKKKFESILSGFGGAILWVAVYLIVFFGIPKDYRKTIAEEKQKKS